MARKLTINVEHLHNDKKNSVTHQDLDPVFQTGVLTIYTMDSADAGSETQVGEGEKKKRESDLGHKMMKRVDTLEEELQDIQTKLNVAVQMITEKDKELEELKSKILHDGVKKLDQAQNVPSKKTGLDTKFGPKVRQKRFSITESDEALNNNKPPNFYDLISDNIEHERRLSETIEERIKRVSDYSKKPVNQKPFTIGEADLKKNDNKNKADNFKQPNVIEEGSLPEVEQESVNGSLSSVSVEKTSQEMEEECLRLRAQVEEMEQFLGDYGMIWVGDMDVPLEEGGHKKMMTSVGFTPDFDKAIMVIGGLNEKAGSETKMEIKDNVGRFKKNDVLKLTIYVDGIQLEDNDFREYSSESVQEFFKDLDDGYYPTELKGSYPDGVIFKVVDMRNKTYTEAQNKKNDFPGKGQKLGRKEDTESLEEIESVPSKPKKEEMKECKLKHKQKRVNEDSVPFIEEIPVISEKLEDVIPLGYEGLSKVEPLEYVIEEPVSPAVAVKEETPNVQEELNKTINSAKSDDYEKQVPFIPQVVSEENESNIEINIQREEPVKVVESIKKEKSDSGTAITFRDNINITNITYNEAPMAMNEAPPQLQKQPGYSQEMYIPSPVIIHDEHGKMERAYADFPTRNIMQEHDDEFGTGMFGSGHDGVGRKQVFKGSTEYSEKISDNVKEIEEAIKQYASENIGDSGINPNQQFAHISIIGAKPKLEVQLNNEILNEMKMEGDVLKEKLPKNLKEATQDLTEL